MGWLACGRSEFQCSSASRKFLNRRRRDTPPARCSVSVLFSEPKIPQFITPGAPYTVPVVSVLFSEPKIPQWARGAGGNAEGEGFQCSSASRKFLNAPLVLALAVERAGFSALQRAENSSIDL